MAFAKAQPILPESPPETSNTGERGSPVSELRPSHPATEGCKFHCVRSSKSAEDDRADENEHGTDRDDVDLQGNVHEGGSMAINDEQSLAEKRRSARGNHVATQ
jgi:hypothetical protein